MSPTQLLAKRDLRKRPGQAITILVLTLLAAALLNTATLLLLDYNRNIDRKAAEWNSPGTMAVAWAGPGVAELEQALAARDDVTDFETTPSAFAGVTIDYGDADLSTGAGLFVLDDPVRLGKATRVAESPTPVVDPIWAPAVLQASGYYDLGDPITFVTTAGSTTFHIQGFFENLYGGAPGMGLLSFGVPDLDHLPAGFAPSVDVKVMAATPLAASQALDRAVREVNATAADPVRILLQHDVQIMKDAATMSGAIFVAIFVAMAAIIVLIAGVVIRFILRNLIATDATSIGTLRAAGFTTGGIISALVTPYVAITLIGSLAGIGASYLLMPSIETSCRAQNGISWAATFSPTAALITTAAALAVVVLPAAFAAARVRRITTVAALRGGIATHSHQVTRLPLASTRGNLTLLLGLKAALRNRSQNVAVVLTIAVTAFAAVFGFGLFQNLLSDRGKATELLVGELEDVAVIARRDVAAGPILDAIQQLPGVSEAYYSTLSGQIVDGLSVGFLITDTPGAHSDPIVAGRVAEHANEVTIGGRLADVMGLAVGDTYTIDIGTGPHDFLVAGITSSARYMGQSVAISTAGYQRIDPAFEQFAIAIHTPDRAAVIDAITAEFGSSLMSVVDQQKNIEAQLSSYLSMTPIVSTAVISLTTIVTALVVGLLVTTLLLQTRRELGVKKAMGFTNGQLSAQTRWTYLPAVAAGVLIGTVASAFASGPLTQILLRGVGILQVDFDQDWAVVAALAAGIFALAWVTAWASSRRISRISAYALVAG